MITFSSGIEPRLECDLGIVALAAEARAGAEGAEWNWNAAWLSALTPAPCGIAIVGEANWYKRFS